MGSERTILTVEEIAAPVPRAIAMGPFGSNIKTDNFVPKGVPVIRGQNLNAERFNDSGFVFLTEEKADELVASNAFSGDLVFTHRGTLGQVGIIPLNAKYERYVVSQSQMKLTCDSNKVDPLFLFYFFRSPHGQYELLANTSTTGVPAISRPLTTLKAIKVTAPPLPEQRAIAHILGSLDDKIELNRQMNETLEAIAQAIFKSWFVDFDPVRAKAEGRDPGLPKEIVDLLSDSFEDSKLGEIPKGWKLNKLGDVIALAYGKALKASNRMPGNVPVYGSNGPVGLHNEALVKGPGIIVGRKGNPGIVTWSSRDFYPIDTTFYVVPKTSLSSLFYLFYALKAQDLPSLSADSAVPGLNRNLAYMNQILVPLRKVLSSFDKHVSPLFERIDANEKESITLSTLRDTLLPKLLSGELRVPDTEKFLMEAGL